MCSRHHALPRREVSRFAGGSVEALGEAALHGRPLAVEDGVVDRVPLEDRLEREPAASKRSSHFAAVRAPRISLSSGMSASRFCTRRASVSKRGSFASSGRSSAAQHFVQSALLATPSVRYASAALKTSYGTIEGWAFPRRAGRAPVPK